MAKGDSRTSVTMPPGLYDQVKAAAENDNRKIAPQIVTLIQEALGARKGRRK